MPMWGLVMHGFFLLIIAGLQASPGDDRGYHFLFKGESQPSLPNIPTCGQGAILDTPEAAVQSLSV